MRKIFYSIQKASSILKELLQRFSLKINLGWFGFSSIKLVDKGYQILTKIIEIQVGLTPITVDFLLLSLFDIFANTDLHLSAGLYNNGAHHFSFFLLPYSSLILSFSDKELEKKYFSLVHSILS